MPAGGVKLITPNEQLLGCRPCVTREGARIEAGSVIESSQPSLVPRNANSRGRAGAGEPEGSLKKAKEAVRADNGLTYRRR
tara:strand:- start:661 stop:903 length:243 start_codon:yes stop_codon:yes gene_type:complete